MADYSMKKVLVCFVAFFFSLSLVAQITISSANHIPTIGSSYDMFRVNSPFLNLSSGGLNATWDLSSLNGTAFTYNYLSPSSGQNAVYFPAATLLQESSAFGNDQEQYFSSTNNLLSVEGSQAGSIRSIYSSPMTFTHFPMTFGDIHISFFSGTTENVNAPTPTNVSGNMEMVADGYGDLILPYGTVSNTLRVRLVSTASLTTWTVIGSTIDTTYLWYNSGTSHFIASYTISYFNGLGAGSHAIYIAQSDLDTSGAGLNLAENDIDPVELYPNPSKGLINIVAKCELKSIELFSDNGQLIQDFQLAPREHLYFDTSNLVRGIYLLKYSDENVIYTKKVVLE